MGSDRDAPGVPRADRGIAARFPRDPPKGFPAQQHAPETPDLAGFAQGEGERRAPSRCPIRGDAMKDAVTEELKNFEGTWKQIACEKDGVAALDEMGWESRTTFLGDTFAVTLA